MSPSYLWSDTATCGTFDKCWNNLECYRSCSGSSCFADAVYRCFWAVCISEYYDGAQEGFDGMVAHWVSSEFLSVPGEVPKQTFGTGSAQDLSLEAVVRQSDAFEKHSDVLLLASKRLMDSGTCTLADFQATRGWSLDAARQPATFFIYCSPGGKRKSVFLDPITGTVFH